MMSEHYQRLDQGHFDYGLQTLPGLPGRRFRGPGIDPSRPFFACVGAAQTFGRFCEQPYPALLSEGLGVPVLNLAVGGAGPRLFGKPEFLAWINRAEFVVVQVMSSRSESNSMFDNTATDSPTGVRTSDGKKIRFEEFLADLVARESPDVVRSIVEETRENYVRHFIELLRQIRRPKVVLWFSQRSPDYREDYSTHAGILGDFPQLVTSAMLQRIRPYSDGLAICVSKSGLPQSLWTADRQIAGTRLRDGELINVYYPSPEMHAEAAHSLAQACSGLVPGAIGGAASVAVKTDQPTRYLIVAAERTGTNLLRTLLDSHPGIAAGGELFNPALLEENTIHWPFDLGDQLPGLNELRRSDPVEFVERLFGMSRDRGYRAVGFKLMYSHGRKSAALIDHLVGDRSIRVIHLKRRNLLRRSLSAQRARATGVWWVRLGQTLPEVPRLQLDLMRCLESFANVEASQVRYAELFREHAMLELFYEDMVADLETTATRAVEFLGLSRTGSLRIRSQRTGTDSLRDAIDNYDDLKRQLQRWLAFFED